MLIIPTILLSINRIQNFVVDKVTQTLEEELHTKISIGHIDLRWFNHLQLTNFYIEDQNGDTLAAIDKLDAKFSLWPLFLNKLYIKKTTLSQLSFNLKIDADKCTNIDFIIDALNTPQENNLNFEIHEVQLKNSAFSFTQTAIADSLHNSGRFQAQHIALSDIDAKIQFNKTAAHTMSGAIDYLNFKEHSGFELKNLSTSFAVNDSLCRIPSISIELPNTKFKIGETTLNYDNWEILTENFNKVKFKTEIEPSNIYLPDLKVFAKEFGYLKRPLKISGAIKGTVGNLKASSMNIKYGDNIDFLGNYQVTGLPSIDEAFFFANIDHLKFNKNGLQDLLANLTQTPVVLPREMNNIGNCNYTGQMTGFLSNLVAYGKLQSGVGLISTDISLQVSNNHKDLDLNGSIKSNHLNVGRMLPSESGLGVVSFVAKTNIRTGLERAFKGSLDFHIKSLEFKEYNYKDIRIKGDLTKRNFAGNINLNDDNIKLKFDGNIDMEKKPALFKFNAKLSDFRPYQLHLTDKYPELCAALQLTSDFESTSLYDTNGSLHIDSITLKNGQYHYFLDRFTITSRTNKSNTIEIKSDFISGFLSGNYKFETLKNSLINIGSKSLPVLTTLFKTETPKTANNLKFFIEIEDTRQLCDVFEIPWYLKDHTMISGFLNDKQEGFGLDFSVLQLCNNKGGIDNINIKIRNENKKLLVLANAVTKLKSDTLSLFMNVFGEHDSIMTHINVENSRSDIVNAGEVLFNTYLHNNDNNLIADIQLFPTEFMADNKTWSIAPAAIKTNFKWISLSGFNIKSDDNQNIIINGTASKSKEDKIDIALNDISLDYISTLMREDAAVEFGGRVSGNATVYSALDIPLFNADVVADNFIFNRSHFGRAHATANIDFPKKCINFHGIVANNDEKKDTTAILIGQYFIGNDSLDIKAEGRRLDLRFLSYYLHTIFDDVQGYGTGQVYIHGFTKKRQVTVEVNALVEQGLLKVAYLQTPFTFSDSIILTPTEISLKNIEIKDKYGNKGKINGRLNHKYFKNMDYRFDIDCNNMLVLNTTKKDNPDFYGTIFATGKAVIQGNEAATNITCNAKTEKNSRLFIPMNNATAAENKFITFVDRNADIKQIEEKTTQPTPQLDNDLFVNLLVNITPNAEVQLLLDPQAGDKIRGTGYGNLHITYNSVDDGLRILGEYEIESGNYLFTFQNALRKEFKVENGSKIHWNGDPANPTVELKAYYQLTASLKDILDESILNKSNRTTVPVKCILELSGLFSKPMIKFNIDLPNSDEELNRALDAVVSTEEMMNRQIISLLIMGKFYAPELIKDATGFGQNDLLAIVSSTLSTQLNNWASQLFEKWNFGVNFRTTGIANTQDYGQEYEFNFLYMPNNRITFNGNVGYRNDKMNPTNFIGDFDFEYKLIQSGKLSLKAYTHTNDYKEFKTGLTTQGIGFVYKENFGSLKELFANWKQSLTPKTPEEKAALKEQRDKEKAQRKAIREWRKRERAEAQAKQDAKRKAAKEQKKLEKEQAKKQATKE
ncbi:MAG: translocation/assembly module TamB domain-containing protein [Paludibacteraceae bacterium]|nr:translocation/assembly module TamB domain-containing protein [Paludibacteraceae bacterium]